MNIQERLENIEREDVLACPVCRDPDHMEDLLTDVLPNRPSQSWRICVTCGHTFVSPRPTAQFLADFYASGYREMTYRLKEPEDKTKIPVASVNEERGRAMHLATMLLALRTKFANHLDIGSSTGALCAGIVDYFAPPHSWGVEPNDAWRGFAQTAFEKRPPGMLNYKDDVHFVKELKQVPRNTKFELVTVIHTLEHLIDPRGVLEECVKRMRPTGLLVVEVPNRYGGVASPLMWPHLHCFTIGTLTYLFQSLGLEPVLTETFGCFPPFFPPPQSIVMVGSLVSTPISAENVLARFNQYRAAMADYNKRVTEAQPRYDFG